MGVAIQEECEVTEIARENGRAVAVRTAAGPFDADHVVLAAGAWTPRLNADLGCRVPIQPGKGYSLTFPPFADGPTGADDLRGGTGWR